MVVPKLFNLLIFCSGGELSCKIVVVALIAHEYINKHTDACQSRFIRKCLIEIETAMSGLYYSFYSCSLYLNVRSVYKSLHHFLGHLFYNGDR